MELLSDSVFGDVAGELEDCFLFGEDGCVLEVLSFADGGRGAAGDMEYTLMVDDFSLPGERGSLIVLLVLVGEVVVGDDSVTVLLFLALVGEVGVEL